MREGESGSGIGRQRRQALLSGLTLFGGGLPGLLRAAPAAGRTLNVGFVVDMVPFVIRRTEGVFPDLMREALSRLGYGIKVYDFSNVAVSLAENRLQINSVDDLRGKDIVAFNNASEHLKEPFRTLWKRELKGSRLYHEVENQRAQFEMLLAQRTQIILLDRTMVRYYAAQFGLKDMKGLSLHEIFPETNAVYAVGKDAVLVESIAKTMQVLKRDGTVQRLLRPYE